ncbi:hypothetical protein [Pseudomonas phage Almagne]|nr:hypothetical protein [Pseudomonas phage Almagne]
MAMKTAVAILKTKLENGANVEFRKDDEHGNRWSAHMDGEVLVEYKRTLSQVVWEAARHLGEDV